MSPWMLTSEILPTTLRRTGERDRSKEIFHVLLTWRLRSAWEPWPSASWKRPSTLTWKRTRARKTPFRGSWPSANWKRPSTWTRKPPGGSQCWQACSIHLHCRYLKKMLEAGKRNGLGLEGDDLEELKLVQKKISELGIAFKLCFIIIIQIFRILISVVSILPQVLSERGHFSHLGEGRRSCRSASRSCLHSRTPCLWGVEGASMTNTCEMYYYLSRWPYSTLITFQL